MKGPHAQFSANVDDGWLKLNAGQTGFFRVAYNESEWDLLKDAIATQSLEPVDRLGLQNDAYALVKAGTCQQRCSCRLQKRSLVRPMQSFGAILRPICASSLALLT